LVIKDQDIGAVGDAVAEIEAFEPVVGKRCAAIGGTGTVVDSAAEWEEDTTGIFPMRLRGSKFYLLR